MTEVEKIAAVLKADMPDALKVELIQKLVGSAEYPPPIIVYPSVTPVPTVPSPWDPWPITTWCFDRNVLPDGVSAITCGTLQ